uniref:Anti-sigma factor antagonist n=1 Tax=Schlesneria paludicola TaxID=360056 RepID=A0A7C2K0E9_9PLAN
MSLSSETFGSVVVIHAPDELLQETAQALQDSVRTHLEQGHARIVLQMDRTDLFDSQGLESLLDVQEGIRAQGGRVCLSGLTDTARTVLEMTRLDRCFEHYESVIDAVSHLK